ncbi:hypothetical protein B4918_31645 (plasmid) [Bacillus thuringiensis]|uniref:Uncharacterized protein n=1 Tax=Bacillus thuringiensis TaxID=1428 RepID=A0A9W3XMD0_BACTU|nr:hypothetical protein B4918_31645 [Bacillus thuringiensis]
MHPFLFLVCGLIFLYELYFDEELVILGVFAFLSRYLSKVKRSMFFDRFVMRSIQESEFPQGKNALKEHSLSFADLGFGGSVRSLLEKCCNEII